MRVKPRGKVYSVNEGYSKFWYDPLKEYVEGLKNPPVISPALSQSLLYNCL